MRRLKGYSAQNTTDSGNKSAAAEQLARAREKYGNLDEQGLMKELSRQIAEQKENGSFDAQKTAAIVRAASPYLSDDQKNFLFELCEITE